MSFDLKAEVGSEDSDVVVISPGGPLQDHATDALTTSEEARNAHGSGLAGVALGDGVADSLCSTGVPPGVDATKPEPVEQAHKRHRCMAASALTPLYYGELPVDTFAAIVKHGLPETVLAWEASQTKYFGGHPPLPPGWIRVWSQSRKVAYFLRLSDAFTTFEWSEMRPAGGELAP